MQKKATTKIKLKATEASIKKLPSVERAVAKKLAASNVKVAKLNEEVLRLKALNLSLQQSQLNYASQLNNLPQALLSIDAKGVIKSANKQGGSLLKSTMVLLFSSNLKQYIFKKNLKEYQVFITNLFNDKKQLSTEVNLVVKDKLIPVKIDGIISKNGAEAQLIINRISIEVNSNFEQRFLNEERLKLALLGSNQGVWDWNIITNEVYFSAAWKEMLGFKDDELQNDFCEWSSRVHPEDVAFANAEIAKAFKTKNSSYVCEHRVLCKNGTYKWIEARGKVISWLKNGKPARMVGTHTDIDELIKNRLLVKSQKEFYENIIDTIPTEIIVLDKNQRYLFANPTAIPSEELRKFIMGKTYAEYLSELKKDEYLANDIQQKFKQVVASKKVLQWKDEIPKNKEVVHKLRGLVPHFDQNEDLNFMVGFGIDITALKKTEEAFVTNQKLMGTILQTLPVAVFTKDIKNDYKFHLWNKRAEEIFGLTHDEAVGKTQYEFFTKKVADLYRKKDIEATTAKKTLAIELETVHTKNGPVLVHTRKTVVRDADGVPLYLVGVSEDVTDLTKAETLLKISEEKYRSLVVNAPIIIMTINLKEIITFTNFSGGNRPIDEIIGKSIYNFLAPEYHLLVKRCHQNVIKNQVNESYETEGLNADGTYHWFQTHVGPIISANKVVGLTLFTRNITSRKNYEEKIKRSLTEKEILLKEVHHRVKNNLQITSSILNLQASKITDVKMLEILRDSQQRIKSMSLIHELLYQTNDFSKINFSEYVNKIVSNLISSYSKKNDIELTLNIENVFLDLDASIPCGLIVNELVTNSLKYAFQKSNNNQLKISLKQIKQQIELEISDNGPGLPNKFNFRKTKSLGLQLVVALVEQLEGEIHLQNTNGASFKITFKANNA
jgi:PAS domain S-box-containing protein